MNRTSEKQVSAWRCGWNECLQGGISLLFFGLWYAIFYVLLTQSDWTIQVWLALVLTALSRTSLLHRNPTATTPSATWRGWAAADFLVIGFFLYTHPSFPEHGFILFLTPVFTASFMSSPFLIARLSALVLVLFIVARSLVEPPPDAILWIKQISMLLLFLLAAMFISVHQHRRKRTVARFGSDALALFERVHLNLLLMDQDQKIIEANRSALNLLHADAASMRGQSLRSVILDSPEKTSFSRLDSSCWSGLITQPDGTLRKVNVEQVPLSLPLSLDRLGRKGNTENGSLVLVTDMSAYLEQHETERVARQNAVLKRMLEVFADGVRNPLAGISAHIQMLARNGAVATDEEVEAQRMRFNTIVEEIAEVDTLMETLMNHARLTPEDVEKRFQDLKEKRQSKAG